MYFFCIKTFRKKNIFCIWMKILMSAISEWQRARFYIYKKQKNAKRFYIQKPTHFSISRTICDTFLYAKSMTLYVTRLFIKKLNLAFIYKKHDILRYVTFLYSKSRTLRKKQDNLRYVFIFKIWTLSVTRFFIEFLKFADGGGIFMFKKIHFALHLYVQKTMHFALRFISKI